MKRKIFLMSALLIAFSSMPLLVDASEVNKAQEIAQTGSTVVGIGIVIVIAIILVIVLKKYINKK